MVSAGGDTPVAYEEDVIGDRVRFGSVQVSSKNDKRNE